MRIGVDTGGTFTDFVVQHSDGRLETFKLRSEPRNPAAVIIAGIQRAAGGQAVSVVHGSTVATNALLERKGARTAFITTAGFEDIFHIGRQNRAELYNLTPQPRTSLLQASDCFGAEERIAYDGQVLQPLDDAEAQRVAAALRGAGYESVAICLLHAYQNPQHERQLASALSQELYLTCSHEICPEHREYERASTTILNSYVGPLMDTYLRQLEEGCPYPIAIMQSSGGLMTAREARRHAVQTLLSGPAGGVVGAMQTAMRSGFHRILGFDMGGTSTDVSLCDGTVQRTTEASVDRFPVRLPLLDIETVGAGGGSLARVDAGGLLRVGPQSAGADPGPACYGRGDQPTVTDAHVVLGRIAADQLAGGSVQIDPKRSHAALERLGAALHLTAEQAAAGVLRVANASMERAIRNVSVERGHDPRDFVLTAFGGCGALHACEIAEELEIAHVLVPVYAGALSALGMLLADRTRDYSAGVLGRSELEPVFAALEQRAMADLPGAAVTRTLDLRYRGQSYELNIPWSADGLVDAFHAAHERRYGYADRGRELEWVTARVQALEPSPRLTFPGLPAETEPSRAYRRIYTGGDWHDAPLLSRPELVQPMEGPLLVIDYGATTLAPPGWRVRTDEVGNLLLHRIGS